MQLSDETLELDPRRDTLQPVLLVELVLVELDAHIFSTLVFYANQVQCRSVIFKLVHRECPLSLGPHR